MMDRKQRVYDFTEGLKQAKRRVDAVPEDIGNRADPDRPDPFNAGRLEARREMAAGDDPGVKKRQPREPSENELLVNAALAIELNNEMSDDDLVHAKTTIERAMEAVGQICGQIKGQIDEARERRYRDNEYADPGWWRRVNGALRAKSWQRQELQRRYGEINRKLRTNRHANVELPRWNEQQKRRERLFVQVAKLHLDPAIYERLWGLVDLTEAQTKNLEEGPK